MLGLLAVASGSSAIMNKKYPPKPQYLPTYQH